MNDPKDKISFGEKVSYGLGDTASNFFFQFFNIFLMYYYTDVFGIGAGAASFMIGITKIWDAFTDPAMGLIADRTQTRWGKFRPYLIWMAIPYGVIGYAMFANPELGETGKLVYAYITYTLMMTVYTAINIPYGALMGVMTPDSGERTSINSYRFFFAFLAALLLGMFVRPFVRMLGDGNEADGFQLTMAVFAVLSVVLFYLTFRGTKERVTPIPGQKQDVFGDLGALFRNVPWLIMVVAGVFTLANVAVRGAGTVYFFKYYLGDDNTPYFWIWDKTSLFMTLGTVVFILGVLLTKPLAERFDKRNLLMWLTLLNAAFMGLLYFIPSEAYWTMVVVNCLASLFSGPTPALVWSMYADVADYGEWKYDRRSTALTFSAAQFAQKMGLALGAIIPGAVLSYVGYVANEGQSAESMQGIRIIFTLLPAAFAVIAGLAIIFYPIRESLVKVMEKDLRERRESAS